MPHYELIAQQFQSQIEHLSLSVDAIADILSTAADQSAEAIFSEQKLFSCGAGLDSASAMILSDLLRCGLSRERPTLPVIELTSRHNQPLGSAATWLSQQLTALGQPNDLAVIFASTLADGDLEIISAALIKRQVSSIWIGGQGCGPSLLFPGADPATTLSLSHSAAISLAGLVDVTAFGPLEDPPS